MFQLTNVSSLVQEQRQLEKRLKQMQEVIATHEQLNQEAQGIISSVKNFSQRLQDAGLEKELQIWKKNLLEILEVNESKKPRKTKKTPTVATSESFNSQQEVLIQTKSETPLTWLYLREASCKKAGRLLAIASEVSPNEYSDIYSKEFPSLLATHIRTTGDDSDLLWVGEEIVNAVNRIINEETGATVDQQQLAAWS